MALALAGLAPLQTQHEMALLYFLVNGLTLAGEVNKSFRAIGKLLCSRHSKAGLLDGRSSQFH